MKKLFQVRKYVWADSVQQAIRLEKKLPAEDVYVDDEWKRNSNLPKDAIGFYAPKD